MWSPVEGGGGGGAAPCSRGKHSATLLGGHVYVLGGRGAGGAVPLRDFWRYTIATGAWERLRARGEAPPSLQEHSATAHAGRLYVFGGEPTALSAETPLWIYDAESEFWRKLPGQVCGGAARRRGGAPGAGQGGPSGRRGHSAHALRDCLLIYGGYKDLRGSTNELWAFHYESESWQQVRTARAGPARHRHAAALHDARLYVHAGQCDLRLAADLWTYDTMSRVWSAVRAGGGPAPAARSGHAAARAGAHLYIFGGDAVGAALNDMWRFHFATETWERILPGGAAWPAARVDACALLVRGALPGARVAPPAAVAAPGVEAARGAPTLLARLSSFQARRAPRAAYSALGSRDSTESLPRDSPRINKSRSAHLLARRPPPAAAAPALTRDPLSVPDFADMVPHTAAPPAKLVYLDSDEEDRPGGEEGEEGELSTSDYASAERVVALGRELGFSNPHYLGPDVRRLGLALTPDSGVGEGDMEMRELGRGGREAGGGRGERLQLVLVGGREPPHPARLHAPLALWTYRLL